MITFKKMSEKDNPSFDTNLGSSNTLKNITNMDSHKLTQRNCVVKIEKLASQKTTKPIKRKVGKSNENVTKKKSCVALQPQDCSEETSSTNSQDSSLGNVIKKYEQLQKVISKSYVTVVSRLKLNYVPVCCENLEFCHEKHYKRAPPPKLPSINQMNLIRNSLQQARYNVFLSLVWSLCHKEQFPGDIVLTNIVKMILTLNPESKHNAFLQGILDQLLCLFDVIMKTFPPCWLALRQSYTRFLRNTMEISSLLPDKPLNSENTIFEIVLMLLEDNLDDGENTKLNRSSMRKKGIATPSKSALSSSSILSNYDNEYHNMQHWEKNDKDEQTFSALSKTTRIERLMQVLHFLAKMLEMDLAMWMLRYHKNPAKHIYNNSSKPLVIELFSLSEHKSSSLLVKKVMSLFSLCVEKNLNKVYLSIMDRFISLLANVPNLCEIENLSGGIRYPHVGPRTTAFTMDLYKTAEVNMKTNVCTYMRLIRALNCPFVRYEYVDIFLKRLNPAPGKMNPQKIFENFRKSRWLECDPDENRPAEEPTSKQKKSVVYRADYLELILLALRSYCEFFALKDFFYEIVNSSLVEGENNNNISKSRSHSNCNSIDLSSMRKSISRLENKIDMSVRLRVEKEEIPVVNIAVNADLLAQYRNDLKYATNLSSYISALQLEHNEDFSEMIEFLLDFARSH